MNVIDIILAVFAFALGSAFASFAGVVAYRVPQGISIIKPDSYCPNCKRTLTFYENIPIFAYIFLRGKCRSCGAKIGAFGFVMELLGGLGFLFAYLIYGAGFTRLVEFFIIIAIIFLFLIIAGIDRETHYIYNSTLIAFSLLAVGLVLYRVLARDADIIDYCIGAGVGFGSFLLIQLIAKLVLKREALGSGDIFIVGIGGAMLGIFPLLFAILVGTLLGSVIEIIKIKLGKSEREEEIAFAPYLLFGIGAMAVFGETIMEFYWRIML